VARQLIGLGFEAAALEGGYAAWRARYPVEPKGARPGPSQPFVVQETS
jgi:hypothetical protein